MVPRARIGAESESTGAQYGAISDSRGAYHLLGLPPGQYAVSASASGFAPFRQTAFQLQLGAQTLHDITLTLTGLETIDVTAQAPLLQTANGSVSYAIDHAKVSTLPLDGRNFVPLIALSPGVALPGGGSLLPRINGSRPRTNEYLYDGISILQPEPGQVAFYPIIDAIEEFRLNINAYSPEYGKSNGGTVMVASKSGGNQFHGSLFEFFRNEKLNARNFFAQPGAKPEFRRNQYGATLGGPIKKNRTFFFADWQGTRLRTGITRFSTVPTDAQRASIAPSQIDSVAAQVLAHYPHANLPGAANNYVRTAVEPDKQDQFDLRLDHYLGAKHRLFARYAHLQDDDNPVTPLPDGSGAIPSGAIGHAITHGDGIAGEYDWTLSPRYAQPSALRLYPPRLKSDLAPKRRYFCSRPPR